MKIYQNNMERSFTFTAEERHETYILVKRLLKIITPSLSKTEKRLVIKSLNNAYENDVLQRDAFGLNPVVKSLQTALIAAEQIGVGRDAIIATLLYCSYSSDSYDKEATASLFGTSVATIISGLVRIQKLYKKNPVVESENFRNLLLSFAEDMRVILLMIAERVNLMRQIRDAENEEAKKRVSQEASYLYAPLAHKLGLYQLKSELEDLSLKYLEHDAYYMIKDNLNATKKSRREIHRPYCRET